MLETCILSEIFVQNYPQGLIQKPVENAWFGSAFHKKNPVILLLFSLLANFIFMSY